MSGDTSTLQTTVENTSSGQTGGSSVVKTPKKQDQRQSKGGKNRKLDFSMYSSIKDFVGLEKDFRLVFSFKLRTSEC